MERCQEISQCVPTIAEVTAITEHQTYQGIAERLDAEKVAVAARFCLRFSSIRYLPFLRSR